ncbi:YbfB/YjiJ family MFS transporter [Burkholderia guangdongensis]|uniref:YbfB/YjiJ family MFS transporter n=1 Tax=Burkholderia guangdongensis TaxID=1792500 RepID=UPI0015CE0D8E|nr:YbfB/YjiJ family MFS transporter [Burkholderia guangdongensis]
MKPIEIPGLSARTVALACAIGLAVALGVGRFAFTPLLPLMLADGSVGLRAGGWLASANYAGYFIGAMSCARFSIEPARMVRFGLVATVLLTALMGVGHALPLWLAARFVAGVVSAWTFVFVSQWGLRRLAALHAPAWGGVIYTGPGVGIVLTGLAGRVLAGHRAEIGWLGFALLAAGLSAAIWRSFGAGEPGRASAMPVQTAERRAAGQPESELEPEPESTAGAAKVAALVVCYAMPGFGYIITATFLPVIARAALPAGSPWPDLFWPMFGAALMPGVLVAARLPAHWDNRMLLAGGCAMQAIGIVTGIVWPTAAGFAIGSVLIGLPFTAITLFALREARRLHGERAAGLMGYLTASYGVGQIAGPLVAAPLAAHTGSFTPALWLAVAALIAGAAGFVVLARQAGRR